MIRKIIIVLYTVIFLSSSLLTACGNKANESQSNLSSNQDKTTYISASGNSQTDSSSNIASQSISENSGSYQSSTVSSATSSSKSSSVGNSKSSASISKSQSSSSSTSTSKSSSSSSAVNKTRYYLAGSWNGYLVNDEFFEMELVAGSQTFYTATVSLTADNRDANYDGHWYKVTEGNWTNSYGIDNYIQQPAPVKKTPGGQVIGMGSIWIDANMTLIIMFDSANKIVYDNANGKTLPTP